MSYFMHVDVTDTQGEVVVSNRDSIAHDKRMDAHALASRYVGGFEGRDGFTVRYYPGALGAPFGHWVVVRPDRHQEWVSVVSA